MGNLATKIGLFQIAAFCLGSGSFGTVFLVMNLKDKCLMAMKQIHIRRENNDSLKALVEEVDILRHLDHPNLVKYYGVEVHKVCI